MPYLRKYLLHSFSVPRLMQVQAPGYLQQAMALFCVALSVPKGVQPLALQCGTA